MKRGVLTLILLVCIGLTANATATSSSYPRFTFGAEWNYDAVFINAVHQYFYAPEGFIEEIKQINTDYHNNIDATVHAGYNFNENWNLSLYLGCTQVGEYAPAIPISLRATRYFGANPLKDRWFSFIDLGSGISIKKEPQEIFTGKIGGGYRLSLGKYSKLDFLLALRAIYTHPVVEYGENIIDRDKVNRNDGYVGGVSFGIGLTF